MTKFTIVLLLSAATLIAAEKFKIQCPKCLTVQVIIPSDIRTNAYYSTGSDYTRCARTGEFQCGIKACRAKFNAELPDWYQPRVKAESVP